MPYPKCKIYSDRSHFVAIPHTERPYKPRRKVQEEEIVVEKGQEQGEQESATPQAAPDMEEQAYEEQVLEETGTCTNNNYVVFISHNLSFFPLTFDK